MENCGEQVNITIGLNVNNIIFNMGIIILVSQSLKAVYFCKILCAKREKYDIDIDGKDIRVSIQVSVDKYRSRWYW